MKIQTLVSTLLLLMILGGCKLPTVTVHSSDSSKSEVELGHYQEGKKTFSPLLLNADKDVIYLANPSFEENASSHSTIPNGWSLCRNVESPPDIHSNSQKQFRVTTNASDGQNFLGMVVRDNNTVEHIAQKLTAPLKKDSTYKFYLDLCLSSELISLSRMTMRSENFNTPVVLRIWASNKICNDYDNEQLLHETTAVNHYQWEQYNVLFQSDNDYDFIVLEAYYDEDNEVSPYNGNLMIDNLSPIVKISGGVTNE